MTSETVSIINKSKEEEFENRINFLPHLASPVVQTTSQNHLQSSSKFNFIQEKLSSEEGSLQPAGEISGNQSKNSVHSFNGSGQGPPRITIESRTIDCDRLCIVKSQPDEGGSENISDDVSSFANDLALVKHPEPLNILEDDSVGMDERILSQKASDSALGEELRRPVHQDSTDNPLLLRNELSSNECAQGKIEARSAVSPPSASKDLAQLPSLAPIKDATVPDVFFKQEQTDREQNFYDSQSCQGMSGESLEKSASLDAMDSIQNGSSGVPFNTSTNMKIENVNEPCEMEKKPENDDEEEGEIEETQVECHNEAQSALIVQNSLRLARSPPIFPTVSVCPQPYADVQFDPRYSLPATLLRSQNPNLCLPSPPLRRLSRALDFRDEYHDDIRLAAAMEENVPSHVFRLILSILRPNADVQGLLNRIESEVGPVAFQLLRGASGRRGLRFDFLSASDLARALRCCDLHAARISELAEPPPWKAISAGRVPRLPACYLPRVSQNDEVFSEPHRNEELNRELSQNRGEFASEIDACNLTRRNVPDVYSTSLGIDKGLGRLNIQNGMEEPLLSQKEATETRFPADPLDSPLIHPVLSQLELLADSAAPIIDENRGSVSRLPAVYMNDYSKNNWHAPIVGLGLPPPPPQQLRKGLSRFDFSLDIRRLRPVSLWCEHQTFLDQAEDYRRLVARFGFTNRYVLLKGLPPQLRGLSAVEEFIRINSETTEDFETELITCETSQEGNPLHVAHVSFKTKKGAQVAARKLQERLEASVPPISSIELELTGPRRPNITLWIGNVREFMATEPYTGSFLDMFRFFGRVQRLKMMPERNCSFVEFENTEQAKAARNHLHGVLFGPPGRDMQLNVDFSAGEIGPCQQRSAALTDVCLFCNPAQLTIYQEKLPLNLPASSGSLEIVPRHSLPSVAMQPETGHMPTSQHSPRGHSYLQQGLTGLATAQSIANTDKRSHAVDSDPDLLTELDRRSPEHHQSTIEECLVFDKKLRNDEDHANAKDELMKRDDQGVENNRKRKVSESHKDVKTKDSDRKDGNRQEFDRRDIDRRHVSTRNVDRREASRRDVDRRNVEHREIDRRDYDRRDVERRDRRDADRREIDRRDVDRRDGVDRYLSHQGKAEEKRYSRDSRDRYHKSGHHYHRSKSNEYKKDWSPHKSVTKESIRCNGNSRRSAGSGNRSKRSDQRRCDSNEVVCKLRRCSADSHRGNDRSHSRHLKSMSLLRKRSASINSKRETLSKSMRTKSSIGLIRKGVEDTSSHSRLGPSNVSGVSLSRNSNSRSSGHSRKSNRYVGYRDSASSWSLSSSSQPRKSKKDSKGHAETVLVDNDLNPKQQQQQQQPPVDYHQNNSKSLLKGRDGDEKESDENVKPDRNYDVNLKEGQSLNDHLTCLPEDPKDIFEDHLPGKIDENSNSIEGCEASRLNVAKPNENCVQMTSVLPHKSSPKESENQEPVPTENLSKLQSDTKQCNKRTRNSVSNSIEEKKKEDLAPSKKRRTVSDKNIPQQKCREKIRVATSSVDSTACTQATNAIHTRGPSVANLSSESSSVGRKGQESSQVLLGQSVETSNVCKEMNGQLVEAQSNLSNSGKLNIQKSDKQSRVKEGDNAASRAAIGSKRSLKSRPIASLSQHSTESHSGSRSHSMPNCRPLSASHSSATDSSPTSQKKRQGETLVHENKSAKKLKTSPKKVKPTTTQDVVEPEGYKIDCQKKGNPPASPATSSSIVVRRRRLPKKKVVPPAFPSMTSLDTKASSSKTIAVSGKSGPVTSVIPPPQKPTTSSVKAGNQTTPHKPPATQDNNNLAATEIPQRSGIQHASSSLTSIEAKKEETLIFATGSQSRHAGHMDSASGSRPSQSHISASLSPKSDPLHFSKANEEKFCELSKQGQRLCLLRVIWERGDRSIDVPNVMDVATRTTAAKLADRLTKWPDEFSVWRLSLAESHEKSKYLEFCEYFKTRDRIGLLETQSSTIFIVPLDPQAITLIKLCEVIVEDQTIVAFVSPRKALIKVQQLPP